jgi:hypothetical protein
MVRPCSCPARDTLCSGGQMLSMSQMGQSTKSLRSSPLRGSKSREAGSRSREASDSGVASINSRIVGVQRMIKNNRII